MGNSQLGAHGQFTLGNCTPQKKKEKNGYRGTISSLVCIIKDGGWGGGEETTPVQSEYDIIGISYSLNDNSLIRENY